MTGTPGSKRAATKIVRTCLVAAGLAAYSPDEARLVRRSMRHGAASPRVDGVVVRSTVAASRTASLHPSPGGDHIVTVLDPLHPVDRLPDGLRTALDALTVRHGATVRLNTFSGLPEVWW